MVKEVQVQIYRGFVIITCNSGLKLARNWDWLNWCPLLSPLWRCPWDLFFCFLQDYAKETLLIPRRYHTGSLLKAFRVALVANFSDNNLIRIIKLNHDYHSEPFNPRFSPQLFFLNSFSDLFFIDRSSPLLIPLRASLSYRHIRSTFAFCEWIMIPAPNLLRRRFSVSTQAKYLLKIDRHVPNHK